MVEEANEVWDTVTCFGSDAVHLEGKHSKIPLSPDLEDKSFWQFALGYTLRSPSGAQALYL